MGEDEATEQTPSSRRGQFRVQCVSCDLRNLGLCETGQESDNVAACLFGFTCLQLAEVPVEEMIGEGHQPPIIHPLVGRSLHEGPENLVQFLPFRIVRPEACRGFTEEKPLDLKVEHRFSDIPSDDCPVAIDNGDRRCLVIGHEGVRKELINRRRKSHQNLIRYQESSRSARLSGPACMPGVPDRGNP